MPQLLSQTNGITQGEGDFWKDKRDLWNINNPTQQVAFLWILIWTNQDEPIIESPL